MSYVRIWLHAVWGTKNREPVLQEDIRLKVCSHIVENTNKKNFIIDCIDGHTEHLHCLMNLSPDMAVSKQMQLIKGESSFWINKNRIIKGHFEWADEYFAESVSPSQIEKVRGYILRQKEHHKKVTFMDEYDALLKNPSFYLD